MLLFSGNLIKDKWNNIRDAFMRSLRQKSRQAATKKYLYADFLQFLLKIRQEKYEARIIQLRQLEEETETVVQQMDQASTSSRGAGKLQHQRRKTNKLKDEINRKI
jgi:hypothetical protein